MEDFILAVKITGLMILLSFFSIILGLIGGFVMTIFIMGVLKGIINMIDWIQDNEYK